MRRLFGILLLLVLPAAVAQTRDSMEDGGVTRSQTRDGGASEILQSIYIPPLINAPFTAVLHTSWAKPLPGGGTLTVVNQRRIARDSTGRFFQERWALTPVGQETAARQTMIQIADPSARTLWNCYMLQQPHRCELEYFRQEPMKSFRPPAVRNGTMSHFTGATAHEALGDRMVEDQQTIGARETISYNKGVMGNDQPFSVVRETWFAPSLGINLFSTLADPRIGIQTFTVTNIQLGEPDPGLFELPRDYPKYDARKSPPEKIDQTDQ
jgi:hypothetical protein